MIVSFIWRRDNNVLKAISFERELKKIIYDIREYGIRELEKTNEIININDSTKDSFIQNVHYGFYRAQDVSIHLLTRVITDKKKKKRALKQAKVENHKDKIKEYEFEINLLEFWEAVVRKAMDSLAWIIFKYDDTSLRRFFKGDENIDITDSNLDSEKRFVQKHKQENPLDFVLINDLTTFMQVGDIVITSPNQQITIAELKEGQANEIVLEAIPHLKNATGTEEMFDIYRDVPEKLKKQMRRDLKQMMRMSQVEKVINTGKGLDLFSKLETSIINEPVLTMSSYVIDFLINDSTKKGYALDLLDGCLYIGVYTSEWIRKDLAYRKLKNIERKSSFEEWICNNKVKGKIVDFRQTIMWPGTFPLYLHSFSANQIMDIIFGRTVILLAFDMNSWMRFLSENGIYYEILSQKSSSRIKGKIDNKNILVDEGGLISLWKSNREKKVIIGNGLYSRLYCEMYTPRSIARIYSRLVELNDIHSEEFY